MASEILVVGSMAFDSVETPFGREEKILGGSANYFSLAATVFAPVKAVSVVGRDFPKDHLDLLSKRNVDISGVKIEEGNTFHWSGKYGYDLNEAHTLETCLNVFENFDPSLPESYRDVPFVFLGNIIPSLQLKVLEQIRQPKLVALDTMNFWIEGQKEDLIQVISKCNAVIINEAEARQLTEAHNIVKAAEKIQAWGPKITIIKRGEYGALLFAGSEFFSLPGLPLSEVKDPTGAGDSFAGGVMGYLASREPFSVDRDTLRKAVVYGCVMASFTVQDFSFRELLSLQRSQLEERYQQFVKLTEFPLPS